MGSRTNPVRLYAVIAAIVSAGGSFFIDIGADVRWETALGKALGIVGVVIGGGELGRSRAWAPKTVDDLIDAETVISDLD